MSIDMYINDRAGGPSNRYTAEMPSSTMQPRQAEQDHSSFSSKAFAAIVDHVRFGRSRYHRRHTQSFLTCLS